MRRPFPMPPPITNDQLMRFLDGELPPDEHARVEAELARSTELSREVAIFRAIRTDFQELSFHPGGMYRSVWDRVNVRLTRPVGWILIVVGTAVWTAYGAYVFATGPADAWEKLAAGAVVIGVIMLLGSVIWERYREWLSDPYRDVYR